MPAPYAIIADENGLGLQFSENAGAPISDAQRALVSEINKACDSLSHSGQSMDWIKATVADILSIAKACLGTDPPSVSIDEALGEVRSAAAVAAPAPAGVIPVATPVAPGAPKGNVYFFVYATNSGDDITFASVGTETPPVDMLSLKSDVEDTLARIQELFPPTKDERAPKFKIYFAALLGLAQVGLSGDVYNVPVAKAALATFKQTVLLEEGPKVKNANLRKLGMEAIVLGSTALVAAIVLELIQYNVKVSGDVSPFSAWLQPFDPVQCASLLTLWAGSMVGVWVSFAARANSMTFADLVQPDDGQLEPRIRLLFAGILSVFFALLVSANITPITIGSLSIDKILLNPETAITFGFALGFNERLLSNSITTRTAKLFA